MNRELAEVRRYWPRAKRNCQNQWVPRCDSGSITVYERSNADPLVRVEFPGVVYDGQTIAEAMRAAGFGVRPLGGFARHRQRRQLVRQQSADLWGFPATMTGDDPVRLADRQRPRKAARLGARKRRGWYAVAATYPRYELRDGSDVLTTVFCCRLNVMWHTTQGHAFLTKKYAMRWEEVRLGLPECPVVEVQP